MLAAFPMRYPAFPMRYPAFRLSMARGIQRRTLSSDAVRVGMGLKRVRMGAWMIFMFQITE
eukprot:1374845-Amorphochlora_amoeboformis.AAC.1